MPPSPTPTPSDSSTAALANSAAVPCRARPLLHYKDLGLATQSRKVKFTCVHASENFVACGTNVGSVYLHATTVARGGAAKYHLVKVITPPSNDRVGVACVTICPAQKHLVVGTLRGVVYGLQLSDYNRIGEKVEFSHDFHTGFPVTCFLWDRSGHRLFSACNAGLVCQTVLRAGMSAIFGSTDTELLLKEETGIVQLDMTKIGRADVLLVSSQLRVLLLNLTASGGSAVQIGTKARQGSFGACFFTQYDDDAIDPAQRQLRRVFSSRPGRRVWIADPQTGTVASTIKFSLAKSPSTFVQSPGCAMEEGIQPRDLTINKLSRFEFMQEPPIVSDAARARRSRLVSWNVGSSVLFFLDPIAVEIVEWHLDLGVIHDLKIVNDSTLVVLHGGDSPKVSLVQSCSASQFLDLYGANDVKTSVQLAIEFGMNDAAVLSALRTAWHEQMGETPTDPDDAKLSDALAALCESATLFEQQHLSASELEAAAATDAQPMQVIFKHRPQAAGGPSTLSSFDPSASATSIEDKSITLATGSALHKRAEYVDVLAPSVHAAYSKSIFAPDGSTIDATMVAINELPRDASVLRDADRIAYLDDVADALKRFEQSKSDEPALLPALNLRGNSLAAARAFSTLLPSSSMLSSLMDPAALTHSLGRANMFGDLPSSDDAVVLDPDPRLLRRRSMQPRRGAHDASHEYSVLRIAMSSTVDVDDGDLDTEVLLEAISMDIYDTNLKYTSNLPLSQQFDLPETVGSSDDTAATVSQPQRLAGSTPAAAATKTAPSVKIAPAAAAATNKSKADVIRELKLQPLTTTSPPRLERRNTVSPSPAVAAQRALQKFIGAAPSCDVRRKCMVGGHLARAPELASVLEREVVELHAELQSAAATAATTKALAQRLWPAAGITRVCACLSSLYLLQGDLAQVQTTIEQWLSCFDPTAQASTLSPAVATTNGARKPHGATTGFARGEALVDGDGLPLTRSDWTLVRAMVSIYFAICAAGTRVHARPTSSELPSADASSSSSSSGGKLFAHELGIALELEERVGSCDSDTIDSVDDVDTDIYSPATDMLAAPRVWSAHETEAFVRQYGAYLNPELAAEVCNLRRFATALDLVLDRAVSSAELSSACDEIVNWVAEQDAARALAALRTRASLCILLHVLAVLLKKCPDDAIDVCVEQYPALYPWNVERSLFGAPVDWDWRNDTASRELMGAAHVTQTATYFRYLARLLEVRTAAGRDAQIVNRCLALCFGGASVVGAFFEQRGRLGRAAWVAAIARQPERFRYDHATTWTLFETHHELDGLLELALQSLQREKTYARGLRELHDLVARVVAQQQLRVLERVFERLAALPPTAGANTEHALHCVLKQVEASATSERRSRDRSDALSATAIYALLNAVPLPFGMQLLAQYRLLFAATPLSMYHTIVETHVLTRRQLREVARLLEVVDTHVWSSFKDATTATATTAAGVCGSNSSSTVSFAPQLAAIVELELGRLRPGVDTARVAKWRAKCSQYDREVREHADREGRSIDSVDGCCSRTEDAAPHHKNRDNTKSAAAVPALASRTFDVRNSDWGGEVQLHDATCAACELPVVIIADDNANLDVVLLPCSHAFHRACLDDAECAICLDDRLETLAWRD